MRTKNIFLGRLTALLLAVLLAVGFIPLPAHAAVDAHFKDVPTGHWAFPYVERAYSDGAIIGTGGDPATGNGKFTPNDNMTYGQFLTMLIRAFYPEELERVGTEGAWYAPAIRVAVSRQLNFNSEDELLSMASKPINRYNAAWFLVRILEDKNVVLPDDRERAEAAASISDWDDLLGDEYWRYYVSCAYALGIITGVNKEGKFDGLGHITRASATAIYTRMADKMESSGSDPEAFRLTFEGDWSAVPEEYRAFLEEEFYTVYPRLWTRFGTAATTKHIRLWLVSSDQIGDNAGLTTTSYDYTRYQTGAEIRLDQTMIGKLRLTAGVFAHELTHAATGATIWAIRNSKGSGPWLIECLADYGQFRYAAWSDEQYMWLQGSYLQPEDEKLRTWEFKAYDDTQWFFAYLDTKYPTTSAGYGLLDSILLAMRSGQVATDGGPDQNDPDLNALVKRMTGYESLKALRQQYIRELDDGTWTFNGFAGYADNYITENLPGVPDPGYFTMQDINLCMNSYAYDDPGEASPEMAAAHLLDGDRTTKWAASRSDINGSLNPGVQQDIAIALDRTVVFDTYVLYHEGSQGNSAENTRAWRIKYYDAETQTWMKFDEVQDNTQDVTVRNVGPVSTRYLWLEILDPSGTGDGIARLYELELYRSEAVDSRAS